MHPFNKPLKDLRYDDIEALVHDHISESRTLDYKRDLYGSNDAEKRKFLCDISALANTAGGYLIIGVDEESAIPKAITPVLIPDFDKQQLLFENLLRAGVDPPIRGVNFNPIDAGNGKCVLVIEIPRSISRPHAVNIGGHWRFYGRSSIDNYPYEVDDVRRAILQSETLTVRMQRFRNDRLAQISIGETPVPPVDGAKTVLHLIPMSSFELGQRYDLIRLSKANLPTIGGSPDESRVNFDGLVAHLRSRGQFSYVQAFHNGIIEAVDGRLLQIREANDEADTKIIPSTAYARHILNALQHYIAAIVELDVEFPIWVCLSLLDVKGYRMAVAPKWQLFSTYPIDRPELVLPETEVENASVPAEHILKPALDSIWNACGFECCLEYDEDGNWTGGRI